MGQLAGKVIAVTGAGGGIGQAKSSACGRTRSSCSPQPRPIRSMHRGDGWSVDSVMSDLLPAFRSSFQPVQQNRDVFCWDPI